MERRRRAVHRFTIDLDLVTADDIELDALVSTLTNLATAGLHGMVAAIRAVSLDGVVRALSDSPADPSRVRLPPDPKVNQALWKLEEIVRLLASIDPPLESLAPVASF